MPNKINEVYYLRPLLILLVIVYHTFAPWVHIWSPFPSFEDVSAYWWIGKLAYSFMLPMFVFISGYVWAYQRKILLKQDSFTQLVKKKFTRLYIPSIIFSVLYIVCFKDGCGFESDGLLKIIYSIINGYAHMWFLPMLFWCFIICYFLLKIPHNYIRWIIVLCVLPLSILPLPLQINQSCYYLLYFYLGYRLLSYKSIVNSHINSHNTIFIWAVYISIFILLTIFIKNLDANNYIGIMKIIPHALKLLCTILIALLGIFATYASTLFHHNNLTDPHPQLVKLNQQCFGIYLVQQFILIALYYHSPLPTIVPIVILPWINLIITLVLSYFIIRIIKLSPLRKYI